MTVRTNAGLKLFMQSASPTPPPFPRLPRPPRRRHHRQRPRPRQRRCRPPQHQGMVELNGRLFKVVSSSGSTLGMADVDGVTASTPPTTTPSPAAACRRRPWHLITGVQDFVASGRRHQDRRYHHGARPADTQIVSAPTPCPPT